MSDAVPREWIFACPSCRETLTVDDDVRALLLTKGCVLCRAGLSDEAFSRPRCRWSTDHDIV